MMTIEKMMQVMEEKDASYEGIFFICVKTTKIFCRPGCTARTPKRTNVEFVNSAAEAIEHGYRPCKICRPLDRNEKMPGWIGDLLGHIQHNPEGKLSDADLLARGIHPNRLRRWFLKSHGMTFQAFQRSLLIGQAFRSLKKEKQKVVHAALDSGYDSLSGFTSAFKKATGFAPRNSYVGKIIYTARLETPLGAMVAGATEEGICLLEFADRRELGGTLKKISKVLDARFVPGDVSYFEMLQEELKQYFAGKRASFDVPTVFVGTKFQKQVWKELLDIPFGHTTSYKALAVRIGMPSAIRAVASANGSNPLAIIVPCHRVIGSNGKLTGYGGGIHRKDFLLTLEKSTVAHV